MATLRARVNRLETRHGKGGPPAPDVILFRAIDGDGSRAGCFAMLAGGRHMTQEQGETEADFLARVRACVACGNKP